MPYTLQIGDKAPDFNLKTTEGNFYSMDDFDHAQAIVVFFTCNHCPYVIGSIESTRKLADTYFGQGIEFFGINSNSANTYPEDSFDVMVQRMKEHKYPWRYAHDPTQEIALAYGALCTPHFFLFNEERKLIYTGRELDNPKDPSKSTVNDLERALEEYLAGKPISVPVTNPLGCNIKWEGKDPHWMPPEACSLV